MLTVAEKKYTMNEFLDIFRGNLRLIERQNQGLVLELPWALGTKLLHVVETDEGWIFEEIIFVGMKVKDGEARYIFEAIDETEVIYTAEGVAYWVKETELAARNTIKDLEDRMSIKLDVKVADAGRERITKFASTLHEELRLKVEDTAKAHDVKVRETELTTPYSEHTSYGGF